MPVVSLMSDRSLILEADNSAPDNVDKSTVLAPPMPSMLVPAFQLNAWMWLATLIFATLDILPSASTVN